MTNPTKLIISALETGVDLARGNAEAVHANYKGYYPERHAAADRDVADMEAALAAARAHLEQPTEPAPSMAGERADGMPASRTERHLRRMLCAQRHGFKAYMDDGEASWGGGDHHRQIDYMRETPEAIERAWQEAGRAALLQSPTLPDPQLCKFYEVETYPELVANMELHIEKLQAKLPLLRDTQPGRVREG
jgi:hypothetical protein